MRYSEWTETVPLSIREDSLWKMAAFRYAKFLSDIAWHDATKLKDDARTVKTSGQLYGAIGSIGANLSEGYSRGTGKDRARFYEYALGSARESRSWYFDSRHVIGDSIFTHRIEFLGHVIRLILKMVPEQRARGSIHLREEPPFADTMEPLFDSADLLSVEDDIPALLEIVPFCQ